MRLPGYSALPILVLVSWCSACSSTTDSANTDQTSSSLTPDTQSTLEEDFDYPGAEGYRASGIVLHKGDGNLVLVKCTEAHVLEVESYAGPDNFCFQILGPSADLTMELPSVFLISTTNAAVVASVSVGGKTSTVRLTKGYTGFVDATLLELRLAP